MAPVDSSHDYLTFPGREEVLAALRAMRGYEPEVDPLCHTIAERLAGSSYDSSAFVFILIELVYDFEEDTDQSLSFLLPAVVQALTADVFLAGSAHDAFKEIKDAIAPSVGDAGADENAAADESAMSGDRFTAAGAPSAEMVALRDELMVELQRAQKRVSDLGLGTRLSIETALSRPGADTVRRTLREIATLRSCLRRFEELLTRSEEQILLSIGVLEGDEGE